MQARLASNGSKTAQSQTGTPCQAEGVLALGVVSLLIEDKGHQAKAQRELQGQ